MNNFKFFHGYIGKRIIYVSVEHIPIEEIENYIRKMQEKLTVGIRRN